MPKKADPRNRLVNIRFTEKEYDTFLRALAGSGCDTVAEFVRKAALGEVKPASEQPALQIQQTLAELARRIDALESTRSSVTH